VPNSGGKIRLKLASRSMDFGFSFERPLKPVFEFLRIGVLRAGMTGHRLGGHSLAGKRKPLILNRLKTASVAQNVGLCTTVQH